MWFINAEELKDDKVESVGWQVMIIIMYDDGSYLAAW